MSSLTWRPHFVFNEREARDRERRPLNLLSEAISLHQKGDLAKAARLYRRILKATPRESNALKFLGLIELQSGNLAQAESLLAASIESNPNSPDCQYYLGRLCLQKKAPDRAKHHFENVIRLEPSHVDALTCLGILHRDQRDLSLALDYFQRAILANSRALEALLGKGGCLIDLERPGEALAIYDHVLSITQKVAEAWHGRGSALRGLKRYQEAIAALQRALAIDPGFVQAFLARGNVFCDLRRHEDALAAYDKALAIKPDLAEAWVARGNVFMRLKHYREADAEYAKGAGDQTRPSAGMGRSGQRSWVRSIGMTDALAAYDRALEHQPGLRGSLVRAAAPRSTGCDDTTTRSRRLRQGDRPQTRLRRPGWGCGIALNGLRRFDEASGRIRQGARRQAELAETWLGAASPSKAYDDSTRLWRRTTRRSHEPDVVGVDPIGVSRSTIALYCFVRNGRHDEALHNFRRALETNPDAKFAPVTLFSCVCSYATGRVCATTWML